MARSPAAAVLTSSSPTDLAVARRPAAVAAVAALEGHAVGRVGQQ
jgi:hypothetical protein